MLNRLRTTEVRPPAAPTPAVELFLGRVGAIGADTPFMKYPGEGDVALVQLVESAMESPAEFMDGLVLWVNTDPSATEEQKMEDLVFADGRVVINQAGLELVVDGVAHTLTNKPFELLQLLAREKGRAVTTEEILDECWGTRYISREIVRVNILPVRKVLGAHRDLIVTERNVGY